MRIEPDRQTVPQGTLAELRCLSTTDPNLQVQWSKDNGNLSQNVQVRTQFYFHLVAVYSNNIIIYFVTLICRVFDVQIIGPLLRIPSAQVKDRGIYICKASNEGGLAQASSIIDIERMTKQIIM